MDEVFRALDDPSRRLLLDRLFERDGQTLTELTAHLPEMTRFGVMNHLDVLEQGGLVLTQRAGRKKFHYLNPVPIRELHDRWISKFTEPIASGLVRLKAHLEEGTAMTTPDHVYETLIRCHPEHAWAAITDGDQTVQYYYGTRVESDWEVGAPITYYYPDGSVAADGEILAIAPPHRLEMSFHARWDDELEDEGPVRMVWLLDDADGLTRVRVEFHGLVPGSATDEDFRGGIPFIVSGLKTLLETGAPLRPAS